MGSSKAEYFSRRAEQARAKAASASDEIIRETHTRFAVAYAQRAAEVGSADFDR